MILSFSNVMAEKRRGLKILTTFHFSISRTIKFADEFNPGTMASAKRLEVAKKEVACASAQPNLSGSLPKLWGGFSCSAILARRATRRLTQLPTLAAGSHSNKCVSAGKLLSKDADLCGGAARLLRPLVLLAPTWPSLIELWV
jgi:hypothetical protein